MVISLCGESDLKFLGRAATGKQRLVTKLERGVRVSAPDQRSLLLTSLSLPDLTGVFRAVIGQTQTISHRDLIGRASSVRGPFNQHSAPAKLVTRHSVVQVASQGIFTYAPFDIV